MTFSPVGMYDFQPMPDIEVDTPGGRVPIEGIGKLDVRFADDPEGDVITLNDVVFVPSFDRHLFSLGACTDRGFKFRGDADGVKVEKTGVYFKKSGPKRLSKALVFRMPPPSAYQANKVTIVPGHTPQKVIDINRFHYSHSHFVA